MKERTNKHSVGQTIAKLRKQKGWTQAGLAEKLQVSDKAVSKWEKDDSYPSIDLLPAIADLFGVSIDDILVGSKEHSPEAIDSPSISEEPIDKNDPRILAAVHDGILYVDEILTTKDYSLISTAINSYPITDFEIECQKIYAIMKMLEKLDWRGLLYYAVDTNQHYLIKYVLERDYVACEKLLQGFLNTLVTKSHLLPGSGYHGVNEKYLIDRKKPTLRFTARTSSVDVLEHIKACKSQLLADCKLQYDKETLISGYTYEYFAEELAKGNTEIVIIRLCVRLEAVLRCDYHFEGDLSEMLNQYCAQYGREDDGWGEANFVKMLHKLRKCRNSIAHPTGVDITMTTEELNFCIEYICKMG